MPTPSTTTLASSPLPASHDGRLHVERISLVVRDLDRVGAFYRDVIGLTVMAETRSILSLGVDEIVLLTLREDPHAAAAPAGMPGLFHTAFLLPTRRDLVDWLGHAARMGVQLDGASDHIVSEAVYLSDPEGNGIEIYVDRPRAAWAWDAGRIRMATNHLDVDNLMAEASKALAPGWRMPAGGRIGHVHLSVASLDEAVAALTTKLGLVETNRYPGAVFMAEGGYHHHVAANVWRSGRHARRVDGHSGLERVVFGARDVQPGRIDGPSGIGFDVIAA